MEWVTRERPKIDRIACPWLILRFIDAQAQFHYVPSVDGVAIKPTLALGSWIGFMPMGDGAMVMGDLVLTETEIEPVMKRLIDDGSEVTALHSHMIDDSPHLFFTHFWANGDVMTFASGLRAALDKTNIKRAP